eukprot:TRINITY_DN5865_c0_g1_i3.p1 TRINITY_DN5865_c0_g1~~TRINITY_DN5865_c0_g1_i3.p1  ORF type:complete len:304 (-),score=24.90 TRINITY_DN5865_c0_g1_i3:144-1055(-)
MTEVCRYHAKGWCKNGTKCTYLHSESVGTNVDDFRKTILCKFFVNGYCITGDDCPYLHDQRLRNVTPICVYFQKGNCFKGQECPYRHDQDQEVKEIHDQDQEVKEIHDQDQEVKGINECSICYITLGSNSENKYGLLNNCDHVFCLACIRKWRTTTSSSEVSHTCPVCRVRSSFVIPSPIYASGGKKKHIEEIYKGKLKTIPCKYFKFGSGICPFGQRCFYAHLNPDGTVAVTPKTRPRTNDLSSTSLTDEDLFAVWMNILSGMGEDYSGSLSGSDSDFVALPDLGLSDSDPFVCLLLKSIFY